MQSNVHILCTRPIGKTLLQEARAQNIIIDELSFIRTIPFETIALQQKIEQAALQQTTVIFTSMNAVEAVAHFIDFQPAGWSVYCIGTTTHELVAKYFGASSIAGTANSAAELAHLITAERKFTEALFFCGKQRRDELPEILNTNTITVTEIIVYETIAITHTITKLYDGMLFFSPSAAISFFATNQLPPTTLLFAIGSTTAAEIEKHTANKIILSSVPGKENLVKKMIGYFS